jgi:hypothetical protein
MALRCDRSPRLHHRHLDLARREQIQSENAHVLRTGHHQAVWSPLQRDPAITLTSGPKPCPSVPADSAKVSCAWRRRWGEATCSIVGAVREELNFRRRLRVHRFVVDTDTASVKRF